ncbi:MAG TPA: two-component system response regulator CreB [Burkholderiaceae bacterium]|nr:two-component system response regulator CreB [Burkholderiaceae bacterium]
MSARILLLEDDPAIAGTVAFALQREGFAVDHVLLVGNAREAAARALPALAILDVGLPDGSGLDLCRAWRQSGDDALRALPVLMLTARAEELDRVVGLELGADDYLTKPFSPRELVARVRALLRRASLAPSAAPSPGLFELDAEGQRIAFAGQWLALTRLEFGLLRALLRSPGRIRSRESLLDEVWGAEGDATDRTVDTHVKTLRAKLRAVRPELEPIATHRGMGYSLAVAPR